MSDEPEIALLARRLGASLRADNSFAARCVVCDADTLSVRLARDGTLVARCAGGCDQGRVFDGVHRQLRVLAGSY
jgi:hypothetical protein